MFYNPTVFDVLPFRNKYNPLGEEQMTGYFIPSYIGAVTEYGTDVEGITRQLLDKRGYCLYKNFKALLDASRVSKMGDPLALIDYCAEFCYTPDEAFALEGNNKFNKENIAELLMRIRALKECPPIETGFFKFTFKGGKQVVNYENVSEVVWRKVELGKIRILQHPAWLLDREVDEDTGQILREKIPLTNNLYVAGIDGIDIGASETSALTKDPSDFCMVVKKRIFGLHDPQYVAIYKDRPNDIREAYRIAIALAMYYNCKINIEATRRGMTLWAREQHFLNYFMKRPSATYNDISKRKTTEIGTPATPAIIDHQTDLIRDFVNDYSYTIWFEDMLDELSRYNDENKRKFDIVASMAMAELADEELSGVTPKAVQLEEESFSDFGYYYDENGIKRFGPIPKLNNFNIYFKDVYDRGYDDLVGLRTSNPRYNY